MSSDGDVIVLLHSAACGHCQNLLKIWSHKTGNKKGNVTAALQKINPKLRFVEIEINSDWRKHYPQSIATLIPHFPTIFFFRAEEWNKGLRDLNYSFDQTTIRFNMRLNQGTGRYEYAYEFSYDVKGFVAWYEKIRHSMGTAVPNSQNEGTSSSSIMKSEPLLVPEKPQKKKKKKGVCMKSPVTIRRR